MSDDLTGEIVGRVGGAEAATATTLVDAGAGWDFAIGGLGFHLYSTDDRPYERATAPFRKEQFDNSGSYGDQSLLGFWTVGQMSFHNGSGVRYYEPKAELEARYWGSAGVDVTAPGEVTCLPSWASSAAAATAASWAGGGNGYYGILDGTTLKYATTASGALSSSTPTAGTITCATAAPAALYAGTSSGKIEKFAFAAGTALYTHTANITSIAYAKDRLWAVDANNDLYQLSPNPTTPPVAIASSDLVFSAGNAWSNTWVIADTAGPVMVANGNRIFAVTVGSDGTVPTMSVPMQVAELPTGEVVVAMRYYLGHLTVVTTQGCRVCVVGDGGQVGVGPILIKGAGSGTIASAGNSLYPVVDGNVYAIDLSRQVGQGLEFAWGKHLDGAVVGTFSAYLDSTLQLMSWAGSSVLYLTSSALQTGTLETGLLRYGTLENKKFLTVKVRVGGTAGTVRVSKVAPNGSVVPLHTIDVSQAAEAVINLVETTPAELLGLKFTLTPDGTSSPILRGYQVRALPAPERQRMIRVPLMLHDQERRGATRTTGRTGSAWERLSALEEMEESDGTFTFQDFRTGETGVCYIESVEHRGATPPGRQSSGFGGHVFLTLRKV